MAYYAQKEAVPLGVLYAVGLTETGQKGKLHAFALNIEGNTVIPRSRTEAISIVREALLNGKSLIDIGCMQINYRFHKRQFNSTEAMFNPKENVAYAARFLRSLKQQHGSWTMAVARYHAGPKNKRAQKQYICRVIGHLVTTGFGSWTPESRVLCSRN
jgi:soluble lytic murein transglycosylase-like protein